MPWIAPELREDSGEIAAAERNTLPELIEPGDLHCHTRASDGSNSLREMALAAQRLGWEYLVITDHSQHLSIAHGLGAERLARQLLICNPSMCFPVAIACIRARSALPLKVAHRAGRFGMVQP
ncbi:PHP domain-containing protein [Pseudomonas aeruginosa]|uniref:PHP domain-containing protein n=1 Tax=Pseudomonas TaxID=286 RepID=UPI001FFCAB14|nr:PHP domain-containing protein [Pseudomonas sp. PNPG3]MCK2119971.1 PHP domain-containing protein [Pseudomonas sp. PNPG3]HEP8861188.1 hypothetical protein [Pseudomonas aeruginosa]